MGHLAFLGSRRVNGVSGLHTELMRQTVFRPLHELYPDRIVNVTNGISFRRWLFDANPGLTELLMEVVGGEVLDDPAALEKLAPLADDAALQDRLRANPPRQQAGARYAGGGAAEHRHRSRRACSTCTSSASTNTSGSC